MVFVTEIFLPEDRYLRERNKEVYCSYLFIMLVCKCLERKGK